MLNDPLSLVPPSVVELIFATLLGLFIGLEREWSDKPAGTRTFALITLSGAVLAKFSSEILVASGALFIAVLAALLGTRALISDDFSGLSLTTSVSMLIAYGVGLLVTNSYYLEAVTVAVASSLLLILKRELHYFAGTLSKDELKSATEFSILAFVIYPLLPKEQLGPWNAVDPRLIWLLVIAVSGMGLVNYIVMKKYQGKGLVFTGFFGGIVNSTAVVASVASHFSGEDETERIGVGTVLLADSAMATRDFAIILLFIPTASLVIGGPLAVVAVMALGLSYFTSDWSQNLETPQLETPFKLKRVLIFGGLFLIIVIASAGAKTLFGGAGFILTAFLSGLVSSGTVTTTAVTLVHSGKISTTLAAQGVITGVTASILVKILLAASVSKAFGKKVAIWSLILVVSGIISAIGLSFYI